MQLKPVVTNLINQRTGPIKWKSVQDSFFGAPGLWFYRRDSLTGHCWLDPIPDEDSIPLIYEVYYTHNDVNPANKTPKPISALWKQAVSLVQARRLGYPDLANATLAARLLSLMPTVASAAELDVMRIPAQSRGRLLDIGCGNGEFLKKMRSYGWDVVGMEPDNKAIESLAENDDFKVYKSLDEVLSSEKDLFDIVVLSHVIEHLADPVLVLQAVAKLIVKTGKLIIMTPNIASLGSKIFGRYWRGLEPPRHFNLFTQKSLAVALSAANFYVVSCSTEVRMARSIWFLSILAFIGQKNIETSRTKSRPLLKYSGYFFQLLEALVVLVAPTIGEEIYCVATIADDIESIEPLI